MTTTATSKDCHVLPDGTRITLCHCIIIDETGKSNKQFQWRDWAKRIAYSPIILNEGEARNYPTGQLKPQESLPV